MKMRLNYRFTLLVLLSAFFIFNVNSPFADLVARGEGGREGGGGRESGSGKEAVHQHPDAAMQHHSTDQQKSAIQHPAAATTRAFDRGAADAAAAGSGGAVYVAPQDPNLQYTPSGNNNWGQ